MGGFFSQPRLVAAGADEEREPLARGPGKLNRTPMRSDDSGMCKTTIVGHGVRPGNWEESAAPTINLRLR